jgi:hypothetical protein
MAEPLALTTTQQFEVERMHRMVDSTEDVGALRALSKQLIQAWFCQKAATRWAIDQAMAANCYPQGMPDPLRFGDPERLP